MENISNVSMLGLVTLYNPEKNQCIHNIQLYKPYIKSLIVWDNSPENHGSWFADDCDILYHWTGENSYIAHAINYTLQYAKEKCYDCVLIMDQDSEWADFSFYKKLIDSSYLQDKNQVFTPYVAGNDTFIICQPKETRRIFINSGTVIPTHILDEIGGADEAFPLDALDHDLSYRINKLGCSIICFTSCILYHTIGAPKRSKLLRVYTNDYGRFRTYSITRSHIICYRKHHKIMTAYECRKFYKEIFMWKFIRIVLAEDDKIGRFTEFCKGIRDGIKYKL